MLCLPCLPTRLHSRDKNARHEGLLWIAVFSACLFWGFAKMPRYRSITPRLRVRSCKDGCIFPEQILCIGDVVLWTAFPNHGPSRVAGDCSPPSTEKASTPSWPDTHDTRRRPKNRVHASESRSRSGPFQRNPGKRGRSRVGRTAHKKKIHHGNATKT